jgi:uncharacterized protein YndB with AHSA1/START domain
MTTKTQAKLPLGQGKLGFKVSNYYQVPAQKLWEAITKAEHIQGYFVDRVGGDITPELTPVEWQWKKWGRFTLWPVAVQKEKQYEFRWANHKGKYLTRITFTLRKKSKLIELEIHERGWRQADLQNAFDNCSGWTMFLDYLKAYLTKGIDLRTR